MMRWSAIALTGAIGAGMLLGAAGCVSYAHPSTGERTIAYTNPNTPAVEEIMMAGLRWTVNRYPPPVPPTEADEQPPDVLMAVNVGAPVRGRVYQRIAASVPGAAPLTPETSHLPIYHIGQYRIRGDQAQLIVYRPVTTLGPKATGETVYQEIRLDLRGGLRPWHVHTWREWTPGSAETPTLNYFVAEPPPRRDGPRIGGVYD